MTLKRPSELRPGMKNKHYTVLSEPKNQKDGSIFVQVRYYDGGRSYRVWQYDDPTIEVEEVTQ